MIPNTEQTIAAVRARGELIRGPQIAEFEREFASRLGATHATAASYGRMAFYYLLKAFDLPAGSEIVFPALTFWVIPAIARLAGLMPVFVDVNPETFNLDPGGLSAAITPRTRAVVPTHLYGLPADMDAILEISRRHHLVVIEDCAHALGATFKGQPVGTLGDAGFFSFQLLKPLNTYGGGMAVSHDPAIAAAVRALADAEPWPSDAEVLQRLFLGRVERIAIRPRVFTWSLFPVLWCASYVSATPDVYLWEKIRPLESLPPAYRQRYTNVQAAIGLEALAHLDEWTADAIRHARAVTDALQGTAVETPKVPADRTHVFYQYAIYSERRSDVVRRCIRRGLDVETLHVDVCTRLPMFNGVQHSVPGAERAASAIQLPVHSSLTDAEIDRLARVLRESVNGS